MQLSMELCRAIGATMERDFMLAHVERNIGQRVHAAKRRLMLLTSG